MTKQIFNTPNIVDVIENALKAVQHPDYINRMQSIPIFDSKSVFLKLPRMSGHTTAAFELLTYYPTSWLAYPSYTQATHASQVFDDRYKDCVFHINDTPIDLRCKIISSEDYWQFRGHQIPDIDLMIFDNYSSVQNEHQLRIRDEFMHAVSDFNVKLYVFLG